ncbi:hypothetical protein PSQ40_20895 [Curvibacter sp. HBC61]|uniref:Cyclic nucleotide-binding domain-containing protein n=1 Tax=Curvibacter cyanobacteriorum TaxID=3026422 RepID=A0ABT5N4S0_9BURK|nr:hypothetical protein [Curvibacter sp. HBC61]MDD0841048.1 hypothetical protein [Curvibacter sp. HBC61]
MTEQVLPDPQAARAADAEARALTMGERLLDAGQAGPVWRVTRGVFRLERLSDEGWSFVQLALPGDLIGVEALCTQAYAFGATAVVDSEAVPLTLESDALRHQVLADAFLQQQRRSAEAVRLRSGTVASRVDHFLATLAHATGVITQRVRDCDLPYLRDIALIVDSAPESVCRAMGSLVAPRTRARPARRKLSPSLA